MAIVGPREANLRSQLTRKTAAMKRQAAVLALHVAGLQAKEIARRLDVSYRTVMRDLMATDDERIDVSIIIADEPMNAEDLHIRLTEILDADIADVIDEKTQKYKPIHEWPRVWRMMLTGSDIQELFERSKDGGGSSWDQIGEVVKIKWVDRLKALELLGKLKSVDAFVAQGPKAGDIAADVVTEIDRRIAEGRKRAARAQLTEGAIDVEVVK